MKRSFVPEMYRVPTFLETDKYRLEMLGPRVAEIDFEAVMSSKTRLRSVFSESTEWPRDDMTLDENRADLIRHEREFKSREVFAYTVLSLSREKCIGCVYIGPSTADQFDSEIYLWVRDDSFELDDSLYFTVKRWLVECWPFKKSVFPGRELSWEQWAGYKDHV